MWRLWCMSRISRFLWCDRSRSRSRFDRDWTELARTRLHGNCRSRYPSLHGKKSRTRVRRCMSWAMCSRSVRGDSRSRSRARRARTRTGWRPMHGTGCWRVDSSEPKVTGRAEADGRFRTDAVVACQASTW